VLRIVLPITLSLATDVTVKIVVLIEIIVVVNVDVAAVVPIAIAPVAAPSPPGGGAERNSRTPHQGRPRHVTRISVGIVGILGGSSSINDRGVVRRDVNDVGIGLLNLNHLPAAPGCTAADCLGFHDLLWTGFQISGALGLRAHALDRSHHVSLLRQKRVSQIGCPLNVAGHACHHVRKHDQPLDTWVPWLLGHSVRERFALQILIVVHPLLKLNDFQWVGRSGERLSQEIIRIERDRRDKRIQLSRWKCSCLLIGRRGRHLLRLRRRRWRRLRNKLAWGDQCDTDDGDYAVN
jgi:hypothetical protein